VSPNSAASIRARLKRYADLEKQDFNLVLTRYGLERLLYRLSISENAPNFLLKGALLFQLWYGHTHRPTRDADLLGFGTHDVSALEAIFRSVVQAVVDDGIVFDPDSVSGTEIREETEYGGVRIDMRATLDKARIAVQVDIGFGDAVTPAPQTVTYPVLITEMPAPILRVYPKATVIAEKLHATSVLGMTNSRMKDFFDLWVLLHDQTLNDDELRRAIEATFVRRDTALPTVLPIGLSDAFANDPLKRTQWRAFLERNGLEALDLRVVLKYVRVRLEDCHFPRR
jgi:Nucleotidyl transferase AbiEii toxin, Type IV TA system